MTNLAWHPTHPDKLASIAGQEKSVRWVQLAGWLAGGGGQGTVLPLGEQQDASTGLPARGRCRRLSFRVCLPAAPAACRFWDTRAAKNTATVSTPGNNLYLCYAPDGHYVAVGNREDTVAVIDIR